MQPQGGAALTVTRQSVDHMNVNHRTLYLGVSYSDVPDVDNTLDRIDPEKVIPREGYATEAFYDVDEGAIYTKHTGGALYKLDEVEGQVDLVRRGIQLLIDEDNIVIERARATFEDVRRQHEANIAYHKGYLDALK